MEIEKLIDGNSATVKLTGRLDTSNSPELEEALKTLDSAEKITLDFSGLEYISSAGLRVLLIAHKNFSKKSGMTLINVNDDVMDVFKVTGFDDLLDIK